MLGLKLNYASKRGPLWRTNNRSVPRFVDALAPCVARASAVCGIDLVYPQYPDLSTERVKQTVKTNRETDRWIKETKHRSKILICAIGTKPLLFVKMQSGVSMDELQFY